MATFKNDWLVDESHIESLDFEDKYYLKSLCGFLYSYMKRLPIPVVIQWKAKGIEIRVGNNSNYFPVSVKLPTREWIILCDNWLSDFFPQYESERIEERELTEEEVLHELNKGNLNIDDVLEIKKIEKVKQFCIIERMYKKKDQFKFTINGKSEIRQAGESYKELLPVSKFIEQCNKLKGEELKEYVENHSRFITNLDFDDNIFINHKGIQLINFFIVHRKYLMGETPVKENFLTYRYGKFLIEFESDTHKQDCEKALSREKVIY